MKIITEKTNTSKAIRFNRVRRYSHEYSLTDINDVFANIQVRSIDPDTNKTVMVSDEMVMKLDAFSLYKCFSYLTVKQATKLALFIAPQVPERYKFPYGI